MKQILELFIIIIIIFIQASEGELVEGDNEIKKSTINTVTHIVDGDTFDIASGERIRMIGIDTPERGEFFYKEASVRLGELIEGKEVVLIKDVSETDRYDRLLRHVYYEDVWINKQMIDEGFAKLVTFPPDVSHVEVFERSQQEARKASMGMWAGRNNYK